MIMKTYTFLQKVVASLGEGGASKSAPERDIVKKTKS